MFKVDIVGRLRKMKISKNKGLLPLHEAIVNAFHAIEEMEDRKNRTIRIELIRDKTQIISEDVVNNGDLYPIEGFRIIDNGVGFNEKNFDSFMTSDSSYKYSKGGKGIGRFVWLKTFDEIYISSTYKDTEENSKTLKFKFVLDNDPIKDLEVENTTSESGTCIELINIKSEYRERIPRAIDKVGMKIIEHCLEFFMSEDCPRVVIDDGFELIDLNKKFKNTLGKNMDKDSFYINDTKFDIVHVKLYEVEGTKSRLHYCADNREVKSESLNDLLTDLNGRLVDGDRSFIYSSYISSELLNKIVNDERTDFNYDMLNENVSDITINKKDIQNKAVEVIENHLKDFIEPIKKEKIKSVERYVKLKKPQYRSLLKYKMNDIYAIKPNLSSEELEIELFKIQQKFNLEVKEQGENFLNSNKIKDIQDIDDYKKKYQEYIEKENEVGKASLAEYIIHRKIMIELFDNSLKLNEDEKYKLEEYVHNLIFPMKVASDDIDYEKHNLWLIDERLSYHYYLASDIKMKKNEVVNVNNDDRPDLLIMDSPIVLSNEENKPFNALTIIEFKRPMRNDYNDDSNPISQVFNYTRDIRRGAKLDKNGRNITVSDNSPFYLYIIADITPKLADIAENFQLVRTPDGMGYFGYNKNPSINAYVEIISYEKLYVDAKKRNQILFDKLFKR